MRLVDLSTLNIERAERRPVAMVTDLGSGAQRVVSGSLLATDPLADDLSERLRTGKSGVVVSEGRELLVTVQVPPARLIVIGAVHISQALAPMARLAGLAVVIVDPRTAFATSERFPNVELLAEWPDDVLPSLHLDAYTAVALLTHDPKIDDQALSAALKSGCFYIGALGSRKTHAARCERMRAKGFVDEDLSRIHAPIGLDIGAVSPVEIAVAVLAEIIAARRRKAKRSEISEPGRAA